VSGVVYSSGAFPSWAWDRYLEAFSKVTVVARSKTVSSSFEPKNIDISEKLGVEFKFFPSISNLSGLLFRGAGVGKELRKLVSEHDAVVVRLSSELGLLAATHALELNKKLAVELVDCPWDSYWNYGGWVAKAYAPVVTWRVKRAVKKADAVLYVTQSFLQRRYPCAPDAMTVACSNVNLEEPQVAVLENRGARIRARKDAIRTSPVIGQISSLTGRFKGVQVMIDILPHLVKIYPNVKYKVLGAGDPTPFISQAKALGVLENVEFCGTVPSGQPVLDWLADLDLYVHPSLKEGLPRGVIEAMSQGCPVVASSVAGTPELLPEYVLARPGSARELLERVRFVLSDDCDRFELSRMNFNKVKEYSSKILQKRRVDFWKAFSNI